MYPSIRCHPPKPPGADVPKLEMPGFGSYHALSGPPEHDHTISDPCHWPDATVFEFRVCEFALKFCGPVGATEKASLSSTHKSYSGIE